MTSIWGVSSGSYSDYSVEALFSSFEKAQKFLDEYSKFEPDARLEAFDYDPEPPVAIEIITVHIDMEGNVLRVYDPRWAREGAVGFVGYGLADVWRGPRVLIWVVPTTDKERAIKVANEKRAIILANEAWGDHEATLALLEPFATGGKEPL